MKLISTPWKIHHSVELNKNQYKRLPDDPDKSLQFMKDLEKLGADDIEYNGHFGSYIYFSIKFETQSEHDEILKNVLRRISRTVRT